MRGCTRHKLIDSDPQRQAPSNAPPLTSCGYNGGTKIYRTVDRSDTRLGSSARWIMLAALIGIGCASTGVTADSGQDAQQVAKEFFDKLITKCGEESFVGQNVSVMGPEPRRDVLQMKGARILMRSESLNEADRLNGIRWQGTAEIQARVSRRYSEGSWGQWSVGGLPMSSDWGTRRLRVVLYNNQKPKLSSGTFHSDFGDLFKIECRQVPGNAGIGYLPKSEQDAIIKETQTKEKKLADIKSAREALDAGRNDEAERLARPFAEAGDTEAQNTLGYVYSKSDAQKSLDWYRKSAEQGNADSQRVLGNSYRLGVGEIIRKDPVEAVRWYRKAADSGDIRAMWELGGCYCDGIGVEKDRKECGKWLRKAARGGHDKSALQLYYYYRFEDLGKAKYWLGKAVDLGNAEAKKIQRRYR